MKFREFERRGVGRVVALLLLLSGASCRSPAPVAVDPALAQFAASGRAAFARGADAPAARFYEQALQRARATDDGPEIARNGYNLAACLLRLGRAADARLVLREALAEFGRYRMDSQPAWLLDAKAAQALGQHEAAGVALEAAMAACKSDDQRRDVWIARGDLALERGDHAAARAALDATRAVGAPAGDMGRASRLDLAGRVALAEADAVAARDALEAAVVLWQRAGQTRAMAMALGRAGEAHLLAGDRVAAADRHYRAARSLDAQGDTLGALRQIERGLAAGGESPDPALEALLKALFESVQRRAAASPPPP